jgi:hypothetical protein
MRSRVRPAAMPSTLMPEAAQTSTLTGVHAGTAVVACLPTY